MTNPRAENPEVDLDRTFDADLIHYFSDATTEMNLRIADMKGIGREKYQESIANSLSQEMLVRRLKYGSKPPVAGGPDE